MKNFIFLLLSLLFTASVATQNVTVLPNGKVGIGTNTPQEQLQIGDRWTFHNGGTKFIGSNVYWNGVNDEVMLNGSSSQIRFENNQLRFLVSPGANAGANFTPSNSLTLSTGGRLTTGGSIYAQRNGRVLRMLPNNPGPEIGSNTKLLNFWYTGVGWNYLFSGGYFTVSDISLKTDIKLIDNPLEIITSLRGVSYSLKEGSGTEYGFIAQEVEKVLPEAVAMTKDDLKAVDYTDVIPILVEAVKAQQKEIISLQRELESLKK